MDNLQIRRAMKEQRQSLTKEQITALSTAVYNNFLSLSITGKSAFIYKDFRGEVETANFIEYFKNQGAKISYPLIDGENMLAVIPTNSDFTANSFGVEEPTDYVTIDDIDVAIIPLLACDKDKNRIGFGKGYYDRFLSNHPYLKIGICYDFQVLESVPVNNWDVPLDIIITDKRIIK